MTGLRRTQGSASLGFADEERASLAKQASAQEQDALQVMPTAGTMQKYHDPSALVFLCRSLVQGFPEITDILRH